MAFLGQEEQLRELQDRFKYLHLVLVLAFAVLIGRLVHLQILQGDVMRRFSEENRIKRVRIEAPRGMIFDRNRVLIVDNRPAFDLEITPQHLKESGKAAEAIQKLSTLINMPSEQIDELLRKAAETQPAFMPVKIKLDLTRDEVAKVEIWRISIPGVSVETEIRRTNVFGDVASNFLGYIGDVNPTELIQLIRQNLGYNLGDNIGKSGIEKQAEDILRGRDGEEIIEVDALGRKVRDPKGTKVLSQIPSRPFVPGKNLILTIDQDLQLVARDAFGDKVGGLVAIDPNNGEILAMISRPSFDSTQFSRGISPDLWKELLNNENKPLRDKTLQDFYQPGSVFKTITAIAALEEGVITPETRFSCSGVMAVGKRQYHCWKKEGHGTLALMDAIKHSCDVYFYRVAQKLQSVDQIAKWANIFGFGKKTGIQLARETPGLIPTEKWKKDRFGEEWTGGESLSVAIGQSFVLSTVLQLANAYAAIGNGGTLFRPHYIKAMEDPAGSTIEEIKPEVLQKITLSPATLKIIKDGLWKVVNEPRGTAFARHLPGMDMAGKTGTSQIVRISAEKIYQKCTDLKRKYRHHGLFAAFAPAENPIIAVAVVAEHECSGSQGAAPIAAEVVKAYMTKKFPEKFAHQQTSSSGEHAAPDETTEEDQ